MAPRDPDLGTRPSAEGLSTTADGLLASAYVDGELGGVGLARFRTRLRHEPGLRRLVEDLHQLDRWIRLALAAPSNGPYPGR